MKPVTLPQHFLEARKRPSGQVAIRYKSKKNWLSLNWHDYFQTAQAAALSLHQMGVKAHDRVAILSNTRWEWAVLDFAVQGLRAITVPIYQNSLPEEVEFILNDSEAKILVLENQSAVRKFKALHSRCSKIEKIIVMDGSEDDDTFLSWDTFLNLGANEDSKIYENSILAGKSSDIATLVYTSGTTGLPKGVVLTQKQVLSEMENVSQSFSITQKDSTLCFLPFAHVLGRVELWLGTYCGFTIVFAESIERLKSNLFEAKPTVIIGVPRIFEKIYTGIISQTETSMWRKKVFDLVTQPLPLPLSPVFKIPQKIIGDRLIFGKIREAFGGRLRFAISGGAPLAAEVAEFFEQAGILVLEGYGLTETTGAVLVNTPKAHQFGTVGKPMPNVEVRINPDGEILLKSPNIMREYHKNPPATAEVFSDGYFHTGDIGEWTPEGFLRLTDRKKDLIKTAGGKYVAPQKIENLLKPYPLLSHVLVHGNQRKFVVALLTLNEREALKIARDKQWVYSDYTNLIRSEPLTNAVREIIKEVNSQLASFETIKNFAILPKDFSVETGELTPSLKIKRKFSDQKYKEILDSLY